MSPPLFQMQMALIKELPEIRFVTGMGPSRATDRDGIMISVEGVGEKFIPGRLIQRVANKYPFSYPTDPELLELIIKEGYEEEKMNYVDFEEIKNNENEKQISRIQ
jgi:hypothetical protein